MFSKCRETKAVFKYWEEVSNVAFSHFFVTIFYNYYL